MKKHRPDPQVRQELRDIYIVDVLHHRTDVVGRDFPKRGADLEKNSRARACTQAAVTPTLVVEAGAAVTGIYHLTWVSVS